MSQGFHPLGLRLHPQAGTKHSTVTLQALLAQGRERDATGTAAVSDARS